MAITQGNPCTLGPPSHQGGAAASWLLGGSAAKQAILCIPFFLFLCIPFFLFGTEESKEPQHGEWILW